MDTEAYQGGLSGLAAELRNNEQEERKTSQYLAGVVDAFLTMQNNTNENDQGPCNTDEYTFKDEKGRKVPSVLHSKPLDTDDKKNLNNQILDFLKSVDCGLPGGKGGNSIYIEVGYNLQQQKFNSKKEFDLAKEAWIAKYIDGAYNPALRTLLLDFMKNQNYSDSWFSGSNNTLYYPDIDKANRQHNAIKQGLISNGISVDNILTRFNHDKSGGDQNAYLFTTPKSQDPKPVIRA